MELESVIRDRYSVRKFKDDKVSEELLNKLMEISVLAPSAKNVQPLHILTLTSDDALRKINEASPCIYNAPVVFVVCYDKNNVFNLSNGTNSGSEDASIIATHIMLEATNLGLGTCWINMFDEDKIREAFNLPINEQVVCLIDLGYSDISPADRHNIRKNKEEIFEFK